MYLGYKVTKKYNKGVFDSLFVGFYFSIATTLVVYNVGFFIMMFSGIVLIFYIIPSIITAFVGGIIGYIFKPKDSNLALVEKIGLQNYNKHKDFLYGLFVPMFPFFSAYFIEETILNGEKDIPILIVFILFCSTLYFVGRLIYISIKKRTWKMVLGLIASLFLYFFLVFFIDLLIKTLQQGININY
ncbi:hypothetical protein ACFLY1_00130 [Patescibacteria group bacterium]